MGEMSRGVQGDQPAGGQIVWVGGVFDEATVLSRRAVSPAANRWQGGLIQALEAEGTCIHSISHLPEPLWPRGEARVTDRSGGLASWVDGEIVSYWNLPGVRPGDLSRRYTRVLERHSAGATPPAVVITYNDFPWSVAAGRFAQRTLGIPWVCLVADGPGAGRELRDHEARINDASALVFLSWGRYESSANPNRLHLDGGVDALRPPPPEVRSKPGGACRILLFTGAMNKWAGASLLVDAFSRVRDRNVELWLCGPGTNVDVERAARSDSRIRFLGLLPEKELHEVCAGADVFVNPRPTDLPENLSNFPSKVLEYLTYAKPVVSTWTEGLAPEYRDVLIVAERADASGLAAALERALALSADQRSAQEARIRDFLLPGRLWSTQARRLLAWLHDLGIHPGRGGGQSQRVEG